MLSSSAAPALSRGRLVICPQCGYSYSAQHGSCAWCTKPLTAPENAATAPLRHLPSTAPVQPQANTYFALQACALLQFLPSGVCLPVSLKTPAVLGRACTDLDEVVDLTDLNAYQHGVSRQHCLLRRRGTTLAVTDLDSTNGTYLNGERLLPYREVVVSEGDRLILGSLHLILFFTQSKDC